MPLIPGTTKRVLSAVNYAAPAKGSGILLRGSASGSSGMIAAAAGPTIKYTLPASAPASDGESLTSTIAGVMSWATSGGSPAGADTEIQFNSSGAFGASANLTFGTANTGLAVTAASATTVPHRITLAAAQTANAFEINSSGGSAGNLVKITANGGAVFNEGGAAIDFRIESAVGTEAFKVVGSNGRVVIGNAGASSILNIGGDQILRFNSSGTIKNLGTVQSASGGGGTLIIDAVSIRLPSDVGGSGYRLNIIDRGIGAIAIRLNSSDKALSIRNSSNVETMGLTTTGLTQAGAGNGLARFDVDHTITPSTVDGDGVGFALRTENINGSIRDIAYIDAVYDDISQDDVSLRISVRNGADPIEMMRFRAGFEIVINEDGLNQDFRVESDNAANLLFLDAGLDTGAGGIGLFGTAPQIQQATIVDADGTLADLTNKFNTLLADLEGYGLLKSV